MSRGASLMQGKEDIHSSSCNEGQSRTGSEGREPGVGTEQMAGKAGRNLQSRTKFWDGGVGGVFAWPRQEQPAQGKLLRQVLLARKRKGRHSEAVSSHSLLGHSVHHRCSP